MFRNSGYFFVGLLGGALLAFWPEYVAKLAGGGISGTIHLHAVVMTLWCGLLIAQPFLLRAGRRSLHRGLGKLSYGLVPVLVVAALRVAHAEVKRASAEEFDDPGRMLYLPLSMLALFTAAYALAIAYRKAPALHARFMICTSFAFVDPIGERILIFYGRPLPHLFYYQAITFAISAAALVALIVAERRQARGRAVFPAMLGALAARPVQKPRLERREATAARVTGDIRPWPDGRSDLRGSHANPIPVGQRAPRSQRRPRRVAVDARVRAVVDRSIEA